MRFEWDPRKAKQNLKKHGVSFDEAVTAFYNPLSATFNDPDHSVGEQRYITIGFSSKNRLIVVERPERGRTKPGCRLAYEMPENMASYRP